MTAAPNIKKIDVKNLHFAYGDNPVIKNVSLELFKGRFYGIIGPNGCGKSTLLDLLVGNLKPAAGQIRINGKSLNSYPRSKLAREIALVPQNFYIRFPFSAREIVTMGRYPYMPRFGAPSAHDKQKVTDAMEVTDTKRFSDRLITELSGGERQRVILARALVQDTPILMLDEATSNLDIKHTLSLLSVVSDLVKTGTLVMAVFQDINLAAAFCDDLIFVRKGQVAAQGPTAKALDAKTIRKVFNVDSKIFFEPYLDRQQIVFKLPNSMNSEFESQEPE
jgi:ABC-type cobalamin/Fe3+-siderophores transport system ATPase subunit